MACYSSTSYSDVNIADKQFQPVEIVLHGRRLSLLDSFGRYLGEQVEQERRFKEFKSNEADEKRRQSEATFVHPKVRQAQRELEARQKYLADQEEESNRLQREVEVLTDLIVAQTMDLETLEERMRQVERLNDLAKFEAQLHKEL